MERLAAEHPFEERSVGQLMLALYRAGRQADALEAYQRARRLLADRARPRPGRALVELQQRILERDPLLLPAPAPEAASDPAPAAAAVASADLPRPVTRLVGREDELQTLSGLSPTRMCGS